MPISYSQFAPTVTVEGAFGVLAVARQLKAAGKRVIELEIGDSPFPSTPAAKQAGLDAIRN
jgi:aspartate aminotransferase